MNNAKILESDVEEIKKLFFNIKYIVIDNKYMHQIIGFILFLFFKENIFKIENIINYVDKDIDEQGIADLSTCIKFVIYYMDNQNEKILKNQFLNELSNTKLFEYIKELIDFEPFSI